MRVWPKATILFLAFFALPGAAGAQDDGIPEHPAEPQPPSTIFDSQIGPPLREAISFLERLDPYSEGLSTDRIVRAMLEGLVNDLGDPYAAVATTSVRPGGESTATRQASQPEYGFLLERDEYGRLTIASVDPARGGDLRAGERVLRIAGTNVSSLDPWQAFSILLAESGDAHIVVEGEDAAVREVTVAPLPTPLHTVTARIGDVRFGRWRDSADGETAWIGISSFAAGVTQAEWNDAVRTVWASDDVNQIVLDLRGNGGGDNGCISILGDFFPAGVPLVEFRALLGDDSWSQTVTNSFTPRARLLSFPVAVLVDRHTASLAEIFAAALQESRNAPLVGESTYGKGTTQSWLTVGGFALHVTTGSWHTPAGRSVQNVGLMPEVEIDAGSARADAQMLAAAISALAGRRR